MRLGGVMHDGIMSGYQLVQQFSVADVAMHKINAVAEQWLDVVKIARVCQCVQHCDVHVRVIVVYIMDEIRADEAAATGHDDVFWSKHFLGHSVYGSRQ